MAERVEILGLDKVLKSLKRLEPELKRKSLLNGAKAGARVFKKAIIARTPVRTGALKRSIGVKQMSKKLATISDIVGAMIFVRTAGTRTKKQKISGEDAWYWFLQEYGYTSGGRWRTSKNSGLTRAGFRAKNKRTRKKQPGKHFIKRAFNVNAKSIEAAYKNKIVQEVNKYSGR